MSPETWRALYLAGLMGFAVAMVAATIVDIVRRPPGCGVAEAWGNPSAFRIVAMIGFFGLFIVGFVFRL